MAKYIGKRIVPKHCGVWEQTKSYEMLSIVMEPVSGDSYISRCAVPAGTALTDETFWSPHSKYSQQIKNMSDQLAATEERIRQDNDETEAAIRADNQTTRDHVDESMEETTETLIQTVTQARTEMTNQKADFDNTAQQLNARMDAVLAAGTGLGETEILDARVDNDGITHDTLGAAVRHVGNAVDMTRVNLENKIKRNTNLANEGCELIDTTFVHGDYSTTTCEPRPDPAFKYFAITPDSITYEREVTISCDSGYQFLAYWYDNNNEYISRTSAWTNSYVMPANRHFRLWVSEDPVDITAEIDTSVFAQIIHVTTEINGRISVAESTVSELKDGMQKCYAGQELINIDFENGSMVNNYPVVSTAYKYQAVTPDSVMYDRDVRIKANDGYQFVAYWYDDNDEYVSRNGSARTEFVMPAGRHFRLLMMLNPPDRSKTVSKETFKSNIYIESELSERIISLETAPLTALPEYVKNTLSYKPVGALGKGYICMTCDDGTEGLATYTIPMLIEKGVPATFGLLKTSEVLTNQTYLATLVDAVTNHGCCAAQHGSAQWPTLTESELNTYFDESAELFENAGITEIHGAICPGGAGDDTSILVQAIAGGRFGAVFSGGTHGEIEYGNYHCAGPRTNMYAMNRKSVIAFANVEQYREAIDEAYENHYIFCPFWHDYTIVDSAAYKAIIEGMIDYALEKGLTFITMADLPYIK